MWRQHMTADPWTRQGIGAPTPCAVENSIVIYYWSFTHEDPLYMATLYPSSMSKASTDHKSCGTAKFSSEKIPSIKWTHAI